MVLLSVSAQIGGVVGRGSWVFTHWLAHFDTTDPQVPSTFVHGSAPTSPQQIWYHKALVPIWSFRS